jgi:ABC-type lipoprotein release transport system permease subunit
VAAVLVRLRSEVRRRWAAWLGVALVAGLGGGVVIGLLAGADRTAAAYPEFVREMSAADVLLGGQSPFGLSGSVKLDDVAALPQVKKDARASVSLLFTGRTDTGRRVGPADLLPVVAEDDKLGNTIEKWSITEGRAARPDRIGEATASFVLADRLGLHVGSTVQLHFVKASSLASTAAVLLSEFGARLAGDPAANDTTIDQLADGPKITFRIVGIEASPLEFPPLGPDLSPTLHVTPAFGQRYAQDVVSSPLIYAQLRRPDLLDSFAKGVEKLAQGSPVGFVVSRQLQQPKVETSINGAATALRLVAALVFLAVLLVVAQALVRQAYVEARDDAVLHALGMPRRDLYILAALRGAFTGVAAAVLALVVAALISPLMPIGIARTAELNPGLEVDVAVCALGVLAVVLVVVALRVLAAYRVTRATALAGRFPRRTPVAVRLLDRVTLPPTADAGVRFALDPGRGANAVPVWASLLGITLTIVLLGGLWTFQSSLRHLLDTPHLYGWNWSVRSGAPALPELGAALVPPFEQDPAVEALASGTITQAELGLQRVDVMALKQEVGTVAPTVLEGRLPRRANEVLLGTSTLERAGLHVGDFAVLRLGNRASGLRVVGRGVFPEFGDTGRLGNGVLVTYAGLQRLVPQAQKNVFLVRFRPGTDVAATVRHLRIALDPVPTRSEGRPRELQELENVTDLPTVLAGVLVLLAAATLAHTLLTSVRRRRHELALLQALGFVRRQVWLSLFWGTTALVAIGLLVGLPLGALLGRFVWSVFADGLGAVPEPEIAWLPLLLTIPAALLVAAVIATIPAFFSTRQRPAVALRAE